MKMNEADGGSQLSADRYSLRREGRWWRLIFQGRQSGFGHEQGALYVAYLLVVPPQAPVHAVVLALHAKDVLGSWVRPEEVPEQREIRTEVPATIRAMWGRQRELERLLHNAREPEPVRAEALRELEQITQYLRQTPWMSRRTALRYGRNVGRAILRLCEHLAEAVDADGRPDEVLRSFATHLQEHLLATSARGARDMRVNSWAQPGWFVYVPPQGVVWKVDNAAPEAGLHEGESASRCGQRDGQGLRRGRHSVCASAEYLSRFLCAALCAAVLAGCAGPAPLKGGKAVLSRKPTGVVEETLTQSENPAQATKQERQSFKVRTFTVPAGSRLEASPASAARRQECPRSGPQPSTLYFQPSPSFVLSAPTPVVEREEDRLRTELGAAQKDMARELGARLASLKGVVWVGVGLFIFGLASLVWPPLKAAVGSVTTGGALMAGGVALMVLPNLLAGNELLILGVVGLAVGAWFVAHRHGQMAAYAALANRSQSPPGIAPQTATPGS
jgi:hypothetical protein